MKQAILAIALIAAPAVAGPVGSVHVSPPAPHVMVEPIITPHITEPAVEPHVSSPRSAITEDETFSGSSYYTRPPIVLAHRQFDDDQPMDVDADNALAAQVADQADPRSVANTGAQMSSEEYDNMVATDQAHALAAKNAADETVPGTRLHHDEWLVLLVVFVAVAGFCFYAGRRR